MCVVGSGRESISMQISTIDLSTYLSKSVYAISAYTFAYTSTYTYMDIEVFAVQGLGGSSV